MTIFSAVTNDLSAKPITHGWILFTDFRVTSQRTV